MYFSYYQFSQQQLNMTPQTESDIYTNVEKLSAVIDKRFMLKTLPISDITLSAGVPEASMKRSMVVNCDQ